MIEEINTLDNITSADSPLRIEKSEELFNLLTGVMNEIHNSDYSHRFWKMILSDHVKAVISRIKILEKEQINRTPDLYAFNSYKMPGPKEKFKQGVIRFFKHLRSRNNLKKIDDLLQKRDRFRLSFPEVQGIDHEGIGVKLPIYHPLIIGFGERNKRSTVLEIASRYDNVFIANVIRELPRVYVEHFSRLHEIVKLYRPDEKEFHIHTPQSVFNQFLIAEYVENSARLVWHQHGSVYGEVENCGAHHYEYSVSDEFRTWGWKIKKNDVPWKAYRLEKFREEYQRYSNEKDCVLLVAYSRISDRKRARFKKLTDFLLDNLDEKKYSKILARPQPSNKVHSHKSELDFIEDSRVIKSTGLSHMAEDMSRCKIVLQMSVPSTNFLECIYTNHPTIGVLRNDQPTEVVKQYYDFFVENGVLHHDFESLVAHLNNIDIEEWWVRLLEEPMFKNYRNTFTRPV